MKSLILASLLAVAATAPSLSEAAQVPETRGPIHHAAESGQPCLDLKPWLPGTLQIEIEGSPASDTSEPRQYRRSANQSDCALV